MNDTRATSLARYAWLSIAAAVATISLKAVAYLLTGSVGLLSDALESVINLVAAVIALWILKVAAQPPDEKHAFGHGKAEYFSSGIEGALIFIAALSIAYAAVKRLLNPQELEQVGIGLAISLAATGINLVVARILLRVGRGSNSIVLEADGHHLMTDVWTSVGVVAGIGLVSLTGWWRLDPVVAILVAMNIIWSGGKLISRSIHGLLDSSIDKETSDKIVRLLDEFTEPQNIKYHALRTRQSGSQKFVNFHLLVPGDWTVQHGHDLAEQIEARIRLELGNIVVFTHLEPIEDPLAYEDIELVRAGGKN